jgi:hypothetical protein
LEVGVKISSEFAILVACTISEASDRARVESLKPPPAVNYMSLRSAFHDVLHSLDGLRASQQYEHVWRLSSELEELVSSARESVNKNCTRETLEEAFTAANINQWTSVKIVIAHKSLVFQRSIFIFSRNAQQIPRIMAAQ